MIAYFGGLALLYFAQRSMLFPIPETRRTSPKAAGFPQAEEHLLQTGDGEQIVAWHVPPRDGKPVMIFFHGNGDILAWRVTVVSRDDRRRHRAGRGIVSRLCRILGVPTEAGLINDAEAAYAFAVERYAPDRIVLWGYSLGTGLRLPSQQSSG